MLERLLKLLLVLLVFLSENETKILTTRKEGIGLLNLKTRKIENLYTADRKPVAITYDLARGTIYWADEQGRIYKAQDQKISTLYDGEFASVVVRTELTGLGTSAVKPLRMSLGRNNCLHRRYNCMCWCSSYESETTGGKRSNQIRA